MQEKALFTAKPKDEAAIQDAIAKLHALILDRMIEAEAIEPHTHADQLPPSLKSRKSLKCISFQGKLTEIKKAGGDAPVPADFRAWRRARVRKQPSGGGKAAEDGSEPLSGAGSSPSGWTNWFGDTFGGGGGQK